MQSQEHSFIRTGEGGRETPGTQLPLVLPLLWGFGKGFRVGAGKYPDALQS